MNEQNQLKKIQRVILRSINNLIVNGGFDIQITFTQQIVFSLSKINCYTDSGPFKIK